MKHVRRYTTKRAIDDVICTHPDGDHIGGLPYIVKNCSIGRAWVHDPTRHIDFLRLSSRLSCAIQPVGGPFEGDRDGRTNLRTDPGPQCDQAKG